MFTGIITDVAEVLSVAQRNEGKRFRLKTSYDPATIDIGASIACNGVCLTVVALSPDSSEPWFEVEAWEEAMRLTNAYKWQVGTKLNTERALKMGDEFGGHMVSGHAEGTATIETVERQGDAVRFFIKMPDDFMKFVVPKGSIALDGTSLTVNAVEGSVFDVLIIDHTLSVTTWGDMKAGDVLNFEVDQMARHVVNIIENLPQLQSKS